MVVYLVYGSGFFLVIYKHINGRLMNQLAASVMFRQTIVFGSVFSRRMYLDVRI